jgi:hypothetical protein
LDDGGRIGAIVIDFSEAFDLVFHDLLPRKTAASVVNPSVVVRIREFLPDRIQ